MATTDSQGVKSKKKWFPLESNPDVMNKYIKTLGVTGGAAFTDVFGLDEDLLMMVPQPVSAVVLLYPITEKTEAAQKVMHQNNSSGAKKPEFYMKQTISNACGTVGILHALGNCPPGAQPTITPGSFLDRLYKAAKVDGLTPDQLAQFVEDDKELDKEQTEAAQQGQTQNQALEARIDLHFLCFSCVDGRLWELDGRQPGALDLGECTPDRLLSGAAARIKEYFALVPENPNFTIVAMTAATDF